MATIITHPKNKEDSTTYSNIHFNVIKRGDLVHVDLQHNSGEYFTLILDSNEIDHIVEENEK